MEYLLLVVVVIIVYAEILPTLSIAFEVIRTWLDSKITIIQNRTIHVQEDIQNTQERMGSADIPAIGFSVPLTPLEMDEENE